MSSEEESKSDDHDIEFILPVVESSSSSDADPSQWASLITLPPPINEKRELYKQGMYSPGCSDICNTYLAISDSAVFRHSYYNYPAVHDPGIKKALLDPEPEVEYSDDGQALYLKLCAEMKICPVRMFHRSLLSSEIDLSYYGIDPRGVRPMAMALQYNKTVTRLNLTDNFLSDDAAYHLGLMLKLNITIQELILAGCRIGGSGVLRLGDNLSVNRSLVYLDLSRNDIGDAGGVHFATLMSNGATVRNVSLRYNALGRETALALAEAFEFSNPLIQFDLSWNNFNHVPSTVKMIDSIADSELLQEINLSFNSLEGERVAGAVAKLLLIPMLKILNLSNNRFRDEAITIITANLMHAKKLITFDISFNPLTLADAYSTLQRMLRPRVKLQNLLMESISVDKSFLMLLESVKRMKSRKNFKVVFGDVLQNWTIQGPDPRELLLRRAEYIGKSKGKHSVDIPLYFLSLFKASERPIATKDMIDRASADKIPLSDDFITELSFVFAGPKTPKTRTINVGLICEYIGRLWPDRKLPPTPPPEPEPEPVAPPPKKGKGKK